MDYFYPDEYVCIAIANAYKHGLDKLTFRQRIQWVHFQEPYLEAWQPYAEEPNQYIDAVWALRDAWAGKPTGFIMGLDACASGLQIMSVLMQCTQTAQLVGLIDPDLRQDAYTAVLDQMNQTLPPLKRQQLGTLLTRTSVKQAVMTHFYGSVRVPAQVFPDESVLECFYAALWHLAPGASRLRDALIAAWQPYAALHIWQLPDSFVVRLKTVDKSTYRIKLPELQHHQFSYLLYEQKGVDRKVSLAANVIHSIDGMVCREMGRRCNYDPRQLYRALGTLTRYLRNIPRPNRTDARFVTLEGVEVLYKYPLDHFDTLGLYRLKDLIQHTLRYPSFALLTNHDDFFASPNHMQRVRSTYLEILQDLADSNTLTAIISQIYRKKLQIKQRNPEFSQLISQANYHLS